MDTSSTKARISLPIPERVAGDNAYKLAREKASADEQNAKVEHDKALARVMNAVIKDDTELFKQFAENYEQNCFQSEMDDRYGF